MINQLKEATKIMLEEIEQRDHFRPDIPLDETIKFYSYNTSRNMEEYFKKFPLLKNHLQDKNTFFEIGAGDGIAFYEILNSFSVSGTATNLFNKPNHEFILAEASSLPFLENSFDIIISIQSITWEPNQQKAINEVIRVLNKGGIAFINLYKFSEISSFWFGESFWNRFDKDMYKMNFEFSENQFNLLDCEFTIQEIKNDDVNYNAFLLTLIKN